MSLLEFSQATLFDLEPCVIDVSCAHVNLHPPVQDLKIKGEGLSAISLPKLINRKITFSLKVQFSCVPSPVQFRFAYCILILTMLIAVSLHVTNFSFLYRPFALRRSEPRCHEHLAWVMSLPLSQFFFVTLVSAIFLRYWQITSALKKTSESRCS